LLKYWVSKHGYSQESILGKSGLVAHLTQKLVEKALAGELTHHSATGLDELQAPECQSVQRP